MCSQWIAGHRLRKYEHAALLRLFFMEHTFHIFWGIFKFASWLRALTPTLQRMCIGAVGHDMCGVCGVCYLVNLWGITCVGVRMYTPTHTYAFHEMVYNVCLRGWDE